MSTSPADATVHSRAFSRVDGRQLLFVWTGARAARVTVSLPRTVTEMTEFAIDARPLQTTTIPDGKVPAIDLQAGEVKYFELR